MVVIDLGRLLKETPIFDYNEYHDETPLSQFGGEVDFDYHEFVFHYKCKEGVERTRSMNFKTTKTMRSASIDQTDRVISWFLVEEEYWSESINSARTVHPFGWVTGKLEQKKIDEENRLDSLKSEARYLGLGVSDEHTIEEIEASIEDALSFLRNNYKIDS